MHPNTEWWIAFISIIVFAVFSLICTAWLQDAKRRFDKLSETSNGKISGKILDNNKPIFINVGNNSIEIEAEELKKGFNLADKIVQVFALDIKPNLPVKIYEEEGRILFDVELYNKEKKLVCSIVRNEWQFNPDGKFDRNYSINSIELIDEARIPIIQIYMQDKNKIFVGGYVEEGNKNLTFSSSGILVNLSKKEVSKNSKRLFKYPSSNNLGVLEDVKNLPKF